MKPLSVIVEGQYMGMSLYPTIIITTNGKKTVAIKTEASEEGIFCISGEAICSEKDTFDFDTGAKIAFDRLVGRPTCDVNELYSMIDDLKEENNRLASENEKLKKERSDFDFRNLLRNGVFGRTSDRAYFTVAGNYIVFENGFAVSVETLTPTLKNDLVIVTELYTGVKSFIEAKEKNATILWAR